jgi:hypothetical protein
MNWVKENKFLAGFIAVMLIGIGALGFQVLSASTKLEEAETAYTAKATAYNRLRRLDPFPNRKNLDAFEVQKAEAAQVINAFQADLTKREFPVEPMTPFKFQDELKRAVTEVRAKAAAANVVLKDKFYLGFDPYETAPPSEEAAPLLGRQLKAIEWVMLQLIAARIVEVKELKRTPLPEEQGKAGVPPAGGRQADRGPRPGSDRGGGRAGRGAKPDLVTNHPFDIIFTAKQHQFVSILNTIVSPTAPQFYIPRAVRVTNQKADGPPRATEAAAAPPPADPNAPQVPATEATPAAPAAPAVGDINYIVGEELIEVAMKLEIVDFAEVATK